MKLDVAIQLRHPGWKKLLRPYCKTTRAICEAAVADGLPRKRNASYEMAVVLADDAFIRELNRDYRGQDKPTNVLSFPGEDAYLGDLILAYETVEREAREQGKSAKHHAIHLLVHGTLHLLGYDHMVAKDAARMEALEIKILKKQEIDNPYL